jgi:hypothetical protein
MAVFTLSPGLSKFSFITILNRIKQGFQKPIVQNVTWRLWNVITDVTFA